MTEMRSIHPDLSQLSVPRDSWSAPFWEGTADHRLTMPRCRACGTFRWPAGPFCPECRSQLVEWVPTGQARIYSFTILPVPGETKEAPPRLRIPVLVDFEEAPGVRLVSVLVDADPEDIRIGGAVEPLWVAATDATVALFTLQDV
jgi:uncharacterized OB-fold protein